MGDQGQALAEYALLSFFVILTMTGVFELFTAAISQYYANLAAILSLPVP